MQPVMTASLGAADRVSPSWGEDLVALTKLKLSLLVVLTTAAGFLSGVPAGASFDWMLFLHTVFGTALAAFGASVYNQLMEIEVDRKMRRTLDRPLPAGRMPPTVAFVLGWLLCAAGVVHLGVKVNATAALCAELTLVIYLFAYTPLKRRSSLNTLVGAVSGAIPPVIGWTGAGAPLNWGALWWFLLLFFWQMPHFYAINWMHREEYLRAGFVMLSNEDENGRRTSCEALFHALVLSLLAVWGALIPLVTWWSAAGLLLAAGCFAWQAWRFHRAPDRRKAMRLFLGSLLYLPVALALALAGKT